MKAQTPEEKREMAKELEKRCPEALEMLKAVSKVFGKLDGVEINVKS